jgi:hypothetical protein
MRNDASHEEQRTSIRCMFGCCFRESSFGKNGTNNIDHAVRYLNVKEALDVPASLFSRHQELEGNPENRVGSQQGWSADAGRSARPQHERGKGSRDAHGNQLDRPEAEGNGLEAP